MRCIGLIICFLLSLTIAKAQNNYKPVEDSSKVFDGIEEHVPVYPGGTEALAAYLASNLHYPKAAVKHHIEGRVMVNFVIEKDGKITNVIAVRHVSPELDSEAVRLIRNMPKWKPGTQDFKPWRVAYNIPVNFRLRQKK